MIGVNMNTHFKDNNKENITLCNMNFLVVWNI